MLNVVIDMDKCNVINFVKAVDTQLCELIAHVTCSVCQEFFKNPVTTPCGHSFCATCIKRVLSPKNNSGCPLCKYPVKRYSLENDKVKSTLSDICQELPVAFLSDVRDLQNVSNEITEDFVRASKLVQMSTQDNCTSIKKNKRKTSIQKGSKNNDKTCDAGSSEVQTFVPIVKRSKNVIEYRSAKKKKFDDLVSISQAETASKSSRSESTDLCKKLDKIEKVETVEKVMEWFETVGDNIFHNSPLPSPVDCADLNTNSRILNDEAPTHSMKTTSMVRIDYNKCSNNDNLDKSQVKDPYEFIPSQNNKYLNKKRKKSLGRKKKIPDFQALHNYTKESIKRNTILLNEEEDVDCNEIAGEEASPKDLQQNDVVTASQKFNQLLAETKENEKNDTNNFHTLFPGTQLSSAQFLDCSATSQLIQGNSLKTNTSKNLEKNEKPEKIVTSDTNSMENTLFIDSSELFRDSHLVSERKRKAIKTEIGKKKQRSETRTKPSFSDIMNLGSSAALDLEKSMEDYVRTFKKRRKSKPVEAVTVETSRESKTTLLMTLLNELRSDTVIYARHPAHIPVRLSEIEARVGRETVQESKLKGNTAPDLKISATDNLQLGFTNLENPQTPEFSQAAEMIGFCTQGELPTQEKFLKEMVANMEEELERTEFNLSLENEREADGDDMKNSNCTESERDEEFTLNVNTDGEIKQNSKFPMLVRKNSVVPFTLMGKIKKCHNSFYSFLQLGRLTPSSRRSKSSVVKFMFPAGLTSLGRKRATSHCRKHTVGVQAVLDTRPEKNSSSPCQENQKSQKQVCDKCTLMTPKSCAIVQTSPIRRKSVEVQTNPKNVRSAEIQTSQIEFYSSPKCNEQKSMDSHPSRVVHLGEVEEETSGCRSGANSVEKQTSAHPFDTSATTSPTQIIILNDEANEECVSPVTTPKSQNKRKRMEETPIKMDRGKAKKKFRQARTEGCKNSIEFIGTAEECDWPELSLNMTSKSNKMSADKKDELLNFETDNRLDKSRVSSRPSMRVCSQIEEGSRAVMANENPSKKPARSGAVKEPENVDENALGRRKISKGFRGHEGRQLIPLNVQNVCTDEDTEMVNLEAEEPDAEEADALRNIDLDLMVKSQNQQGRIENVCSKGEKSEESDSDFFVEQTPPRPRYSLMEESRSSRPRSGSKSIISDGSREVQPVEEDSQPKPLTREDSFLVLSEPLDEVTPGAIDLVNGGDLFADSQPSSILQCGQNTPKEDLTTRENDPSVDSGSYFELSVRGLLKTGSTEIVDRVNPMEKGSKSESVATTQKKPNDRGGERQKYCIVASSVKNAETVRKFAAEFKMEYSNKPTKEMTHLIVGLHENDDGEVLPLCTPKLLFAMANKKWVVSESWAENCLKAGRILAEERYETCDPIGGSGCRAARLSSVQLFKNCEVCLYGNFENVLKEELPDLILDCGGTLVSKPEKFTFSPAKIRMIIADKDCLNMTAKEFQEIYEKFRSVVLSRDIIIMSIQSHKLSSFFPYLLHPATTSDLIELGYPSNLAKQDESNLTNIN